VGNELAKAMVPKPNPPLIKRYLDALQKFRMPPYASLLPATADLLRQLDELEPENENSAEFKKIAALTKSLGELQGHLEKNFAKLKQLEDMANKALAQGTKDGSAATEEWAAMEAFLNGQLKAAKTRVEAIHTLEDLADEAVKNGDQAELDAMIKKSDVRATWKPTGKEIAAKFSNFCAKCASQGLSKELQDQLNRDRARFQKIVDEILDLNEQMDNSVKRIQAREIKAAKPQPLDFKALANALKINKLPKAEDKLKAALKLQGSARSKALDAIEKEADVKFSSQHRTMLMNAKAP
jgi:hypothetical protein